MSDSDTDHLSRKLLKDLALGGHVLAMRFRQAGAGNQTRAWWKKQKEDLNLQSDAKQVFEAYMVLAEREVVPPKPKESEQLAAKESARAKKYTTRVRLLQGQASRAGYDGPASAVKPFRERFKPATPLASPSRLLRHTPVRRRGALFQDDDDGYGYGAGAGAGAGADPDLGVDMDLNKSLRHRLPHHPPSSANDGNDDDSGVGMGARRSGVKRPSRTGRRAAGVAAVVKRRAVDVDDSDVEEVTRPAGAGTGAGAGARAAAGTTAADDDDVYVDGSLSSSSSSEDEDGAMPTAILKSKLRELRPKHEALTRLLRRRFDVSPRPGAAYLAITNASRRVWVPEPFAERYYPELLVTFLKAHAS